MPTVHLKPLRLAVCVSGGGTTLQNLVDRIADGRLHAEIVQVVASRPKIGAITRAEAAGLPVTVVTRKGLSLQDFSAAVFEPIREHAAELVILAGFLSLVDIPDDYHNRVFNVHPALIPAFSGKGYHGLAVHQAAIDYGVKVSGCTVHFADATYDTGPIILQRPVPILDDDDAPAVAARVFAAECEALAEAVSLFAEGRLDVCGRHVRILPAHAP
jgi:phosphoribosylglycinamide formyltransferase-1